MPGGFSTFLSILSVEDEDQEEELETYKTKPAPPLREGPHSYGQKCNTMSL